MPARDFIRDADLKLVQWCVRTWPETRDAMADAMAAFAPFPLLSQYMFFGTPGIAQFAHRIIGDARIIPTEQHLALLVEHNDIQIARNTLESYKYFLWRSHEGLGYSIDDCIMSPIIIAVLRRGDAHMIDYVISIFSVTSSDRIVIWMCKHALKELELIKDEQMRILDSAMYLCRRIHNLNNIDITQLFVDALEHIASCPAYFSACVFQLFDQSILSLGSIKELVFRALSCDRGDIFESLRHFAAVRSYAQSDILPLNANNELTIGVPADACPSEEEETRFVRGVTRVSALRGQPTVLPARVVYPLASVCSFKFFIWMTGRNPVRISPIVVAKILLCNKNTDLFGYVYRFASGDLPVHIRNALESMQVEGGDYTVRISAERAKQMHILFGICVHDSYIME